MPSVVAGLVSVVVLAKELREAKTRLRFEPEETRRTALWLATSTVRSVLDANSVGNVLVVTSDKTIAKNSIGAGAMVVPEGSPLGMNRAAALGRRHALSAAPDATVAIIVADLPHLRPEDVDGVIAEFCQRRDPLFVADHHGVGTTFLIHDPDSWQGIAFGRGSAHMHGRMGYQAARRPLEGLRGDLDTPEDFHAMIARESRAPAPQLKARPTHQVWGHSIDTQDGA